MPPQRRFDRVHLTLERFLRDPPLHASTQSPAHRVGRPAETAAHLRDPRSTTVNGHHASSSRAATAARSCTLATPYPRRPHDGSSVDALGRSPAQVGRPQAWEAQGRLRHSRLRLSEDLLPQPARNSEGPHRGASLLGRGRPSDARLRRAERGGVGVESAGWVGGAARDPRTGWSERCARGRAALGASRNPRGTHHRLKAVEPVNPRCAARALPPSPRGKKRVSTQWTKVQSCSSGRFFVRYARSE